MFKKTIFSLLIVISLTFIVLMPQLKMPWTLIDDGEDLRMARETEKHFSSGDYGWILSYEKVNGRFRPVYWLWNYAQFKFFGDTSFNHRTGHLILYTAISILIFLTAKMISNNKLAGIFGVVLFLFFAPAAENYYRVAPIEPPITLLYLLYFFLIVRIFFNKFRNKLLPNLLDYFLISFVLFLAYFMKETAIVLMPAFIPIFLAGLISLKKSMTTGWIKFSITIFLLNIFLLALIYLVKSHYGYGTSEGYASAYTIEVGNTISRFVVYLRDIAKEYNFLLASALILFLYSLFSLFSQPIRNLKMLLENIPPTLLWQMVLLGWFFLFLAIQSPWIYIMGRYLTPIIIWLAIFMGIELSKIFVQKAEFSFKTSDLRLNLDVPILRLVLIFFFGFLVLNHGTRIDKMYQQTIKNEQDTQNLIKDMATNTPTDGKIHANFNEGIMEYLYELPLHFQFYYRRPDIQVDYLSMDETQKFKKGDYVITFKEQTWRYPWDDVKKSITKAETIKTDQYGGNWQVLKIKEDFVFDKQ